MKTSENKPIETMMENTADCIENKTSDCIENKTSDCTENKTSEHKNLQTPLSSIECLKILIVDQPHVVPFHINGVPLYMRPQVRNNTRVVMLEYNNNTITVTHETQLSHTILERLDIYNFSALESIKVMQLIIIAMIEMLSTRCWESVERIIKAMRSQSQLSKLQDELNDILILTKLTMKKNQQKFNFYNKTDKPITGSDKSVHVAANQDVPKTYVILRSGELVELTKINSLDGEVKIVLKDTHNTCNRSIPRTLNEKRFSFNSEIIQQLGISIDSTAFDGLAYIQAKIYDDSVASGCVDIEHPEKSYKIHFRKMYDTSMLKISVDTTIVKTLKIKQSVLSENDLKTLGITDITSALFLQDCISRL